MTYVEEKDECIRNQGRKVKKIGILNRKSKSGYTSEITTYECESCTDCSVKSKCTKAKGNRLMETSKVFLEKRSNSMRNITTPKGHWAMESMHLHLDVNFRENYILQ